MSKKIDEIVKSYELLVGANEKIGHIWKLPKTEDNLYFVLTECSEVIDAMLRGNLEYYRNNAKEINIYEEACDTVMMLMKYLMSLRVDPGVLRHELNYSLQLRDEQDIDLDLLPAILQTMAFVSRSLLDRHTGSNTIDAYFAREDAIDCITDIVFALQDGMLESYLGAKIAKYYKKIQNV